jgi:hypothetical protein
MGEGSYLGGHTVIGSRSGWFSGSKAKEARKQVQKRKDQRLAQESRARLKAQSVAGAPIPGERDSDLARVHAIKVHSGRGGARKGNKADRTKWIYETKKSAGREMRMKIISCPVN